MFLDFLIFRRRTDDLDGLRKIALFEGLTKQELAIVAGLIHTREYHAGEVVFDEGETGQAIYFLREGQVIICRQGRPEDGCLATLGAGEFFGELGLLDDSVRTAQVRAVTGCQMAVLFREDFQGLMESHLRIAHKIGRQLLRHLGLRLQELGMAVGNHRHL
jgi:CRP-like cAMP-binding protein